MNVIAHVRTDFPTKFGIPRQSGLAEKITGKVVFAGEYRNPDALRGLDGFSHIWLIWGFSGAERENWSATVRPPRLGGNARMGVFATRSPFRPNHIGLSCVRLDGIFDDPADGRVLLISGADMMDMTPVYDIKPYIPLTDCVPGASSGFSSVEDAKLPVNISEELRALVPEEKLGELMCALENDPRPRYQSGGRVYGFAFAGMNVRFRERGGVLEVVEITKL